VKGPESGMFLDPFDRAWEKRINKPEFWGTRGGGQKIGGIARERKGWLGGCTERKPYQEGQGEKGDELGRGRNEKTTLENEKFMGVSQTQTRKRS